MLLTIRRAQDACWRSTASESYTNKQTLCNQLMLAKDPLKDEEKSGVLNRVNCEECSSYYFGETSKRLMTRMQEHKSAVRRHQTKSRMWAHISETGHVVDFKKANFQAQAKSKGSRLVQ